MIKSEREDIGNVKVSDVHLYLWKLGRTCQMDSEDVEHW